MDVFKLIYRILKQIRALELAEEPDMALLSPDALKKRKSSATTSC